MSEEAPPPRASFRKRIIAAALVAGAAVLILTIVYGLVRDHDGGIVRGKGETVLLVEDDAAVRNTCQRTLERLGYRPGSARALSGPHFPVTFSRVET